MTREGNLCLLSVSEEEMMFFFSLNYVYNIKFSHQKVYYHTQFDIKQKLIRLQDPHGVHWKAEILSFLLHILFVL